MKKNLLWMLALLALAAMLAACSRGSASSQESASPSENATPAESLTEEASAPEETGGQTAPADDSDAAPEAQEKSANSEGSATEGAVSSAAVSDGLAIPLDSLSAEPLFVDWEQDGTPMQLIALLDGNEIRLAYNTCQSCAGSPYAYFEYANGLLTCQNCGNQFGLDSVGAVVGGCNPLPVGEASVEGDSVVIPAAELKSNAPAFANWKKFA